MRKLFPIILLLCFLGLVSCKKENTGVQGVQTVIKGHVSDHIRGINITGYKIVLVKSVYYSGFWTSSTRYDEVTTAYTDANGDYSVTFNYKVDYDGQSYFLSEQYYGAQYYPEYFEPVKIIRGNTNIVNINAWAPIKLNLNLQVLNNNNVPLLVKNEFNNQQSFGSEFIYDQNVIKTIVIKSKPGSDTKIIFWYHKGGALHQKIIPYQTPLNDVSLNFIIDCSTF